MFSPLSPQTAAVFELNHQQNEIKIKEITFANTATANDEHRYTPMFIICAR